MSRKRTCSLQRMLTTRLEKHGKLLLGLIALQNNVSFCQLVIESVLREIATSNSTVWRFSQEGIADWSVHVTRRIRVMRTHVSGASRRSCKPLWHQNIVRGEDNSTARELPRDTLMDFDEEEDEEEE